MLFSGAGILILQTAGTHFDTLVALIRRLLTLKDHLPAQNVGISDTQEQESDKGNHSKDEVVAMIQARLPDTQVQYKDLTFGGDMRDIRVSFEKIRKVLGFETQLTVEDGIDELLHVLQTGLIQNPMDQRFRNAQFIVQ